jgi:hypothetical protein
MNYHAHEQLFKVRMINGFMLSVDKNLLMRENRPVGKMGTALDFPSRTCSSGGAVAMPPPLMEWRNVVLPARVTGSLW